MSDESVVASMMPKKPAKKKAAPKKKAVAKKKVAVKKKPAVKKKAVKKSTPKKRLNAPVMVEDPDLGVQAFPKDLPKVETPEDFNSNMGVYKRDKDAVTFLIVVGILAALVLATGLM